MIGITVSSDRINLFLHYNIFEIILHMVRS